MRGLAAAQRHYDAMVPDNTDERQDAIDEAVQESMLMGSTYDPTDSDNIAEALSEQEPAFFIALSRLLRSKNMQGAGMALESACHEYWLKVAEFKAIEDYEKRNEF